MKGQEVMTFQEALDKGIIKKNDYFLVNYPNRPKTLFRLMETEKGYVMWGPPTDEKIYLSGEHGYDNLFTLADAQARKEYSLSSVFEDVHACGLPEREYQFDSYEGLREMLNTIKILFEHPDDSMLLYTLASRCTLFDRGLKWLRVFYVYNGIVYAYNMSSSNYTNNNICAVRPEAIPEPTLLLLVKQRNGSAKRPWICLNS